MKYLVDPTLIFGGDMSLDPIVSGTFQPMIEQVVVSMKPSVDPTLLLESDMSTKVIKTMQYFSDPTLLFGSDASIDYVFIISYSIPYKQGVFHYLRVLSLQVLGWFPLIEMILLSLTFLLSAPF
jgi:hypothetical protein